MNSRLSFVLCYSKASFLVYTVVPYGTIQSGLYVRHQVQYSRVPTVVYTVQKHEQTKFLPYSTYYSMRSQTTITTGFCSLNSLLFTVRQYCTAMYSTVWKYFTSNISRKYSNASAQVYYQLSTVPREVQ